MMADLMKYLYTNNGFPKDQNEVWTGTKLGCCLKVLVKFVPSKVAHISCDFLTHLKSVTL